MNNKNKHEQQDGEGAAAAAAAAAVANHHHDDSDFPYETNYNDHFETPVRAFQDVALLLDWLMTMQTMKQDNSKTTGNNNKNSSSSSTTLSSIQQQQQQQRTYIRQNVTLYDPYYCNGRSKRILQQENGDDDDEQSQEGRGRILGFRHVVHEKRDFYKDMAQNSVPQHDVLITNPPYSDNHKIKCLQFCINQWKKETTDNTDTHNDDDGGQSTKILVITPFLLLMPAYVAARKYYRDLILEDKSSNSDADADADDSLSIVYLLPSSNDGPYEYDHPDGTGKDEAPFDSAWFCSVPRRQIPALREYWQQQQQTTTTAMPRLAFSLQELADMKVIAPLDDRRPNPRQRKKRRRMHAATAASAASATAVDADADESSTSHNRGRWRRSNAHVEHHCDAASSLPPPSHAHHLDDSKHQSSAKKRSSKYRGKDGQRTKKRF
jgi:hypothetical protein